jgi:hypothetical protein
VEWHEAVSLARELIQLTQPINPARTAYAGLDEISLSAAGTMVLNGHSVNADAGRWVATVLQTVLAKSEPPVQLRLLAMQAAGDGIDVAHLDESLAYFERPNRVTVLQGLYARAVAAAPDALAPAPVLQVQAAAKPESEAARTVSRVHWGKVASRTAAAVLVLGIAAAATWFAYTRRDSLPTTDSAAASKAVDAIGDAMLAGVSKITETAGLGRLVPADAPPSPPPATSLAARDIRLPRVPSRPSPGPAATPPGMPDFTAFDLAASPATTAPPLHPPGATAGSSPPAADDNGEPPVYSEDSEGIAPPVGVRPQLARELPPTVRREDLTPLELVIGTDGSIESARLVGAPKNVIDSMIVSVAKAWEFEPALKDGKPVKYRKTIWIRVR